MQKWFGFLKLLETGKATVRGWTVDAGALKTQSVPKDMKIGCCDWVTMASIRTNVGFGQALTSVTTLASGTLPFEIAASFKNLGYKNILNETYSTVFWKADDKWIVATEHGGFAYNNPIFLYDLGGNEQKAVLTAQAIASPNTLCAVASGLISSQ